MATLDIDTVTVESAPKRQFGRVCRVTVFSTSTPIFEEKYDVEQTGVGVVITYQQNEGPQIQFEIDRNLGKHPNTCTIRISNLDESTRTAFKKKPLRVVLEAGYDGVFKSMFTGDVIYAMSTLKGATWETLVQCGDGARVLTNARVRKSYVKATPKLVVSDVVKAAGLAIPDFLSSSSILNTEIPGGFTGFGKFGDVLTQVLKPQGYEWSMQDNQVQIIKKGDDEVVGGLAYIDDTNGMIGAPEFGTPRKNGKPPEVTVRVALRPDLRPGQPVEIRSRDLNGMFKMAQVRHKGNTHSDEWLSEITIKPSNWSPKKKAKR